MGYCKLGSHGRAGGKEKNVITDSYGHPELRFSSPLKKPLEIPSIPFSGGHRIRPAETTRAGRQLGSRHSQRHRQSRLRHTGIPIL